MTIDHRTRIHEVNVSHTVSRRSTGRWTVVVDAVALDFIMYVTGTSNAELALVTGYSRAYVTKARGVTGTRVSRKFVADAAEYLSGRWKKPEVLAGTLVQEK